MLELLLSVRAAVRVFFRGRAEASATTPPSRCKVNSRQIGQDCGPDGISCGAQRGFGVQVIPIHSSPAVDPECRDPRVRAAVRDCHGS
jgi:hypothetical protein